MEPGEDAPHGGGGGGSGAVTFAADDNASSATLLELERTLGAKDAIMEPGVMKSLGRYVANGGRGLHSSTSQLNLSALCGIGGARRGCVVHVNGVLGGV